MTSSPTSSAVRRLGYVAALIAPWLLIYACYAFAPDRVWDRPLSIWVLIQGQNAVCSLVMAKLGYNFVGWLAESLQPSAWERRLYLALLAVFAAAPGLAMLGELVDWYQVSSRWEENGFYLTVAQASAYVLFCLAIIVTSVLRHRSARARLT